jgi:hypothetical protein
VGIAAMKTILEALSVGPHDDAVPPAQTSPRTQRAEQPGLGTAVVTGVAVPWSESELLDYEIRVQEAAVESAKKILAEKVARRKRLQEEAAAGASVNKLQRTTCSSFSTASATGVAETSPAPSAPSSATGVAASEAAMRENDELPDDDDGSAGHYHGDSLLDTDVQDEVNSLFEVGEQVVVPKSLFSSDNAHPLLKVLAPSVLEHVRFVRVFFCHHAIANYNGSGFILCRLSVMPATSTAGQAHP